MGLTRADGLKFRLVRSQVILQAFQTKQDLQISLLKNSKIQLFY